MAVDQGMQKKKKRLKVSPPVSTSCRLTVICASNSYSSLVLPELNLESSNPGIYSEQPNLQFHRKVQFVSIKVELITEYGGTFS